MAAQPNAARRVPVPDIPTQPELPPVAVPAAAPAPPGAVPAPTAATQVAPQAPPPVAPPAPALPQAPAAQTTAAPEGRGTDWRIYLPGAVQGYQQGAATRRLQDMTGPQVEGMKLANQQQQQAVYANRQKLVQQSFGTAARNLLTGNTQAVQQAMDSDPYLREQLGLQPGERMATAPGPNGGFWAYRYDAEGNVMPGSAQHLAKEELQQMVDRAFPQEAGQALTSSVARAATPTAGPIAAEQGEAGLTAAKGQARRQTLEENTKDLETAVKNKQTKFGAGQQDTANETAAMGVGQQNAQAGMNAVIDTYKAFKLGEAQGVATLKKAFAPGTFSGDPAGIKTSKDGSTISVVDAAGKVLNTSDGKPATYNVMQLEALTNPDEWSSSAWGIYNKKTGIYEAIDKDSGARASGRMTKDQLSFLKEANDLIGSHYGGRYDQGLQKMIFDDPLQRAKASTAYPLAAELIMASYDPNTAYRIATSLSEKHGENWAAAQQELRQRMGAAQGQGQGGGQPAPAPPPATPGGFVTQTISGEPLTISGPGGRSNPEPDRVLAPAPSQGGPVGGTSGASPDQGAGAGAAAPPPAAGPSPTGGSRTAAPVAPPTDYAGDTLSLDQFWQAGAQLPPPPPPPPPANARPSTFLQPQGARRTAGGG